MNAAKIQAFSKSDRMFYAWEAVSIVLGNGTTVDFVVKDNYDLMVLLHVLQHKVTLREG